MDIMLIDLLITNKENPQDHTGIRIDRQKKAQIKRSGQYFTHFVGYVKYFLTLRELYALTRFAQTDFLTLNFTCITGNKTSGT